MITAHEHLALEWSDGGPDAQWWHSTQRLVATGTKDALRDAFGKLPAVVDIGRRYFVFRAETRLAATKLDNGLYRGQYSGTWTERTA